MRSLGVDILMNCEIFRPGFFNEFLRDFMRPIGVDF